MKNESKYPFNIWIFGVLFIFLSILTLFSFFAAWAEDDSTIGNGFFENILADLFYILRFPTHTLFWSFMPSLLFFPALLINVILYSVTIERLITRVSTLIKKK